jgi:LmbE family N-acetylglucosaminyl deacetylase
VEILAIGAHPDDVELGCGGLLISAARNGHHVYIYTATHGGAGGDPRQRAREAQKSAQFMGAKALWLDDLPDSRLEEGMNLISRIESRIEIVQPDIILTHHAGDVHHDHRTVARATLEAGRYDSNILAYEIPLTRGFDPKIFYDISDVVDDKVELVKLFASQSEKFYLRADAIKGLAEYRALQSRFKGSVNFVEAFDPSKLCLGNEFKLRRVPYEKPGVRSVQGGVNVEIARVL